MLRLTALSLIASLATITGCADSTSAPDLAGGGGGGKADDGNEVAGAMATVDDEAQASLRAADAECLHVNYTPDDTYLQAVKLFCLPRGGAAAPIALYVAVTPLGEADGAYEVFEVPTYSIGVPSNVRFRMDGARATITSTIFHPDFESEEFRTVERTLTTTVSFSGERWQPTVTGAYRLE